MSAAEKFSAYRKSSSHDFLNQLMGIETDTNDKTSNFDFRNTPNNQAQTETTSALLPNQDFLKTNQNLMIPKTSPLLSKYSKKISSNAAVPQGYQSSQNMSLKKNISIAPSQNDAINMLRSQESTRTQILEIRDKKARMQRPKVSNLTNSIPQPGGR